MSICGVFSRSRFVRCLILAFVISFCLVSSVSALEDEATLPHIAKWVNGMAVTAEGVYLSDTWAIDDTGVSDRSYVMLSQGCTEVMRVGNYPEDVTNGDTTPCAKHNVTVSLVLPEGASGDVGVTFENNAVVHTVFFSEQNGYSTIAPLYPGVYRIAGVEVAGDVNGSYQVDNFSQIDTTLNSLVSLEVSKLETKDESSESTTASGKDESGVDSKEDNSAADDGKDNELLKDTVKLVIAVVVLLSIYAVIKYRRQKSEEIRN